MTLRIALTNQRPPVVLALAGRLSGEEVPVVSRTIAEARDQVILDLTWLLSADGEGLQLLRELKARGTGFAGVSPHMSLLWPRADRLAAGADMKIRDLKRKVGSSIVPSWPPARVTSFRGGEFPFGENSQARGRGRSMRREHDFPQPAGKDERAERRGDPPLQRHKGGETWAHIGNPGLQ